MATRLWAWQGGTSTDDELRAVALGSDGSSVSAGYSNGTTASSIAGSTYWTAIKLDPNGTPVWTWENGTAGFADDKIEAAVMDEDGSVVLAGFGNGDFHVIKLDTNGSLLWHFEDGTDQDDYATGIAMGSDGSMVVAGVTIAGEWGIPPVGTADMAAFKLSANGTLLWKWQGGTFLLDWATAVSMAEDGSVVIAGYSSGDFVGAIAGVSDSSSTRSDWFESNFTAIKIDSEGSEVWAWQDGTSGGFDKLYSVSAAEDGSFVMAGSTARVWSGDASAGGHDFAAVKLDADGSEVWRWQGGTIGDDQVHATVVQDDGTIVLGGFTGGDWNGSNAGGFDVAAVALDPDGEEIWRWQSGPEEPGSSSPDDYLYAITAGPDGRVIVAGATDGSWEGTNLGQGDFLVVALDTGARSTSSRMLAFKPDVPGAPVADPTSAEPPASSLTSPPTLAQTANPMPTTPAPSPPTTQDTPPAPTQFADMGPTSPTPQPYVTPAPTEYLHLSPTNSSSNSKMVVVGVASAVAGVALIALGLWVRRRKIAKKSEAGKKAPLPTVEADDGHGQPPFQAHYRPPPPPYQNKLRVVAATTAAGVGTGDGGGAKLPSPPAAHVGTVQSRAWPTALVSDGGRGGGDGMAPAEREAEPTTHGRKDCGDGSVQHADGDVEDDLGGLAVAVTTSTVSSSTGGRDEFNSVYSGDGVAGDAYLANERKSNVDDIGSSSSTGGRKSSRGSGLGRAVAELAQQLALNSQIPGVSEAAGAVSILVDLLTNNRENKKGAEASLKRCGSIVVMLQRAAKVLGKGSDTQGMAERVMIEDVHDAVCDLVELVKTYQSKNRLSQLLMSTLFSRRQEEMGAVVDRAILGLQLGLHVQVGNDVSAVKQDVGAFKEGMVNLKVGIDEAASESLAKARSARRQRKLDQIEIPPDHVAITDEILGKGGFGEVYLADYNGRNAAAKVLRIDQSPGVLGENGILEGTTGGQLHNQRENRQRKALLRELDAMTRLRSPYTVNIYGAITSQQDRLVLVMELLTGGDLRTLLKNSDEALPESRCRQIIRDICAGMAFLHSKKTVHGDIKSANVLLDGSGRAKISDFGTSKWTQNTTSTGLATFTTKSSNNTIMSLAWSAPEVLDAGRCTWASDVYSFGIVAWEVLSRELPWDTVRRPKDVFIHVVLKDLRPAMPDGAPAQIVDVIKACWAREPADRPTFSAVLEGMKSKGWNG